VTPFYPQKLALTSPTGGGRSVGIVRSRTKATEFTCFGQLFCPSSGVLKRTSALVHFMQLWWQFVTRSRMEL